MYPSRLLYLSPRLYSPSSPASNHFLFAESAADDSDTLSKGYDYLLGMKIWSLTLERVKLMENELEAKTEEMRILKVR